MAPNDEKKAASYQPPADIRPPPPPPGVPRLFGAPDAPGAAEIPFGCGTNLGASAPRPASTTTTSSSGRRRKPVQPPFAPGMAFGFESQPMPGPARELAPPIMWSAEFLQSNQIWSPDTFVIPARGGEGLSTSSSTIEQVSPASVPLPEETEEEAKELMEEDHVPRDDHVEEESGRIRHESELEVALSACNSSKSKCEEDLKNAQSEIERLTSKSKTIDNEYRSQRDIAMAELGDYKTLAAEKEERYQDEIAKLKNESKNQNEHIAYLEKQVGDEQNRVAEKVKLLSIAAAEKKSVDEKLNELEYDYEFASANCVEEQEKCKKLEEEKDALQTDLESQISEHEKLKAKYCTLTTDHTVSLKDLQELSSENKAKATKLVSMAALEQELLDCKQQLTTFDELVAERDQALESVEELQKINERLKEKGNNRASVQTFQYPREEDRRSSTINLGDDSDLYEASPPRPKVAAKSMAAELEQIALEDGDEYDSQEENVDEEFPDASKISIYDNDFEGDSSLFIPGHHLDKGTQIKADSPFLKSSVLLNRVEHSQAISPISPLPEPSDEPQHLSFSRFEFQETSPKIEITIAPTFALSKIGFEHTIPVSETSLLPALTISTIESQQTAPIADTAILQKLEFSSVQSQTTIPILETLSAPRFEVSTIDSQHTIPIVEVVVIPRLQLSTIHTQETAPIASTSVAAPPVVSPPVELTHKFVDPQDFVFIVPGTMQDTAPISPVFETQEFSNPFDEFDLEGDKKKSPVAPLGATDVNRQSISSHLPTPPTTPITITVRIPSEPSNHNLFSCWLTVHRQFFQLILVLFSTMFESKSSHKSVATPANATSPTIVTLPSPDISSVEMSDEDHVQTSDFAEADLMGSAANSNLDNTGTTSTLKPKILILDTELRKGSALKPRLFQQSAPTPKARKINSKTSKKEPSFADTLAPIPQIVHQDVHQRALILKNRWNIIYNFLPYLVLYYFFVIMFFTIHKRATWFHANENTRSILTDMFAYRRNVNSPDFFSLRRLLPENVVRAVRLAFFWGAEIVKYEARGFRMPG